MCVNVCECGLCSAIPNQTTRTPKEACQPFRHTSAIFSQKTFRRTFDQHTNPDKALRISRGIYRARTHVRLLLQHPESRPLRNQANGERSTFPQNCHWTLKDIEGPFMNPFQHRVEFQGLEAKSSCRSAPPRCTSPSLPNHWMCLTASQIVQAGLISERSAHCPSGYIQVTSSNMNE